MIYPTAITKYDWLKWYVAQGYGVKTTYGYHEGADINLRTGDDSDLGKPLYAIADGEITSVCETHATKNFGRHLHLKITGKWGVRWAHYCHCQKILVKEGQKVKEGDQIASLGKSGTEYAHLHFAIKNKPTGIEGIAKTKEQLKSWDNPIPFIEKYMVTQETVDSVQITELKIKNAELSQALDKEKANVKKLNDLLNETKKELEIQRTRYLDLEEDCKEDKELLQGTISLKQKEINMLAEINDTLLEEAKLWNALKNAVSSFKDKYVKKI